MTHSEIILLIFLAVTLVLGLSAILVLVALATRQESKERKKELHINMWRLETIREIRRLRN